MINVKIQNQSDSNRIIEFTLPDDVYRDIERIAEFNETTIEQLVHAYICEGVAGNSRIARRVEFEEHRNENHSKDDVDESIGEEIMHDSSLMY